MKLIAGLGNPGPAYRNTRHNVGFMVLDEIADTLGISFSREKFKGLIAEGVVAGESILLLKPLTFMNVSGESVAMAARKKVHNPVDVLIVYDDVELPLGRLRIRAGGSAGTHNGMKSVLERLGTKGSARLRVGVGDERSTAELSDHVLGKFKPDEKKNITETIGRAAVATLCWVENGIEAAMNEFN